MKKNNYKAIRLTDHELQKIEEEIKQNDQFNSFSDFIRESIVCYFNQKEVKQNDKINKKITHIDETTGINLLMMSDLIATQLKMSDKARLEYIQAKKEELEKIIRFDGTLY